MSDRGPEIASFVPRASARAIDLVVQLEVIELAYRLSAFLPDTALLDLTDAQLPYFDLVAGITAFIVCNAAAEAIGGATFGKYLMRLAVVDSETRARVRPFGALLRSLGFFLDMLFFGMVAYSAMIRSSDRQRVGDRWAGTVVLRGGAWGDVRRVVGWPIGIALGVAVLSASYLIAS